jgi:hypothetical protein
MENKVHRAVFFTSCAILGLLRGTFYDHPIFLTTANRHQDMVVCIEKSFAQGGGLSRDQRQSIASAILLSIGHPSSGGQLCHFILPAGGCFAPRHGQAVTLHKAQYFGQLFLSSHVSSITWRSLACHVGRSGSLSIDADLAMHAGYLERGIVAGPKRSIFP